MNEMQQLEFHLQEAVTLYYKIEEARSKDGRFGDWTPSFTGKRIYPLRYFWILRSIDLLPPREMEYMAVAPIHSAM